MRWFLLTALILSGPAFAQTQNGQIVKCHVQNSKWNALVILDAIGAGFLQVKGAQESQVHTCALKLTDLNDRTRGVASSIKIDFDRGSCDPEIGPAYQKEILTELSLRIDMNTQNPQAVLHWLRSSQPEVCHLEKFNLYDLQANAKKFHQGTWGKRATASVKGH